MKWKLPKNEELSRMIDGWRTIDDIKCMPNEDMLPYRKLLTGIHETAKNRLGIQSAKGSEYRYDLLFGLEMYEKLNLAVSTASDDDFWIYLSVFVAPEVVFWRWGPSAHNRYYKSSRRIWLKVMWWYIHLSWQGDRNSTLRVLDMNSTDVIVQLVERSGTHGYRVKLCRTIMKCFGEHCRNRGKEDPQFFRRLMKLNTARLAAVEPALCEGEEEGYVKQLFAKLYE